MFVNNHGGALPTELRRHKLNCKFTLTVDLFFAETGLIFYFYTISIDLDSLVHSTVYYHGGALPTELRRPIYKMSI